MSRQGKTGESRRRRLLQEKDWDKDSLLSFIEEAISSHSLGVLDVVDNDTRSPLAGVMTIVTPGKKRYWYILVDDNGTRT